MFEAVQSGWVGLVFDWDTETNKRCETSLRREHHFLWVLEVALQVSTDIVHDSCAGLIHLGDSLRRHPWRLENA
jgi:hypothetical protein